MDNIQHFLRGLVPHRRDRERRNRNRNDSNNREPMQLDSDLPPPLEPLDVPMPPAGDSDTEDGMPTLQDVSDSSDDEADDEDQDDHRNPDEYRNPDHRNPDEHRNPDHRNPDEHRNPVSLLDLARAQAQMLQQSQQRRNRRPREEDEDEERDRRHPSMRSPLPTPDSTPTPPLGAPNAAPRIPLAFPRLQQFRNFNPPTANNAPPPIPNPFPRPGGGGGAHWTPLPNGGFALHFDIPPSEGGTNNPPGGNRPFGLNFQLGELFAHLGAALNGELGREEQEDPERAKKLVDALEEVPLGLVKRLERVSGGEEEGVCAICWERLLVEAGFGGEEEEEGEEKEAAQKIVSLPCAHTFHSSCLIPWFSRPKQSTCPSCRFDIDPEGLTRRRIGRPQAAPTEGAQPQAPGAQPQVPPTEGQPQTPGGPPNLATSVSDLFRTMMAHMEENIRQGQGQQNQGVNLPFPLVPPQQPTDTATATGATNTFTGAATNIPTGAATTSADAPSAPQPATPTSTPQQAPPPQPQSPADILAGIGQQMSRNLPMQNGLPHIFTASFTLPFGPGAGPVPPPAFASNAATAAGRGRGGLPAFSFGPVPLRMGNNNAPPAPAPPPQEDDEGEGDILSFGFDVFVDAGPMPPPPPPPPLPADILNSGDLDGDAFIFDFSVPTEPSVQRGRAPPPPSGDDNDEPPPLEPISDNGGGEERINPPPPQQQQPLPHPRPTLDEIYIGIGTAPRAGPSPFPTFFPLPRPTRPIPTRPPREPKKWVLPTPPGLTLRERIEKKEREAGLRCFDTSCGVGPSDEMPDVELSTQVQKNIRHVGSEESVCLHKFHPSCLVSAERVANALTMTEEVVNEAGQVEVKCPVCKAQGVVEKSIWDEGVKMSV